LALSQRCGGRDRLYRNTLVFLAPHPRGIHKARQAYRELAALNAIRADYGSQLDPDQESDLKKRQEAARKAAAEALGPAYSVAVRVRGQSTLEAFALNDARPLFRDHLSYVWQVLVEVAEWILRRVGNVTLQETGLIPANGGLRVKDAIEAFLRYTDKPLIATREAVTHGLEQACRDGVVGIGRGPSPEALTARYCRTSLTLDIGEEGVWIIPPFTEALPRAESAPGPVASGGAASEAASGPQPLVPGPQPAIPAALPTASRVGRFSVQGAVPVESWSEVFRCFVAPAARLGLKTLKLNIHFEMETHPGQELDPNDPTFKAMQEAARQLGIKIDIA
jgi:hypothetical protein